MILYILLIVGVIILIAYAADKIWGDSIRLKQSKKRDYKLSSFNKHDNLKKIQTASHFFLLVIAINAIALIVGLVIYSESGILTAILIASFLVTLLVCAVFIQAFTAIKEYLDYISDRLDGKESI